MIKTSFRLPSGGMIDRSKHIEFEFNGKTYLGHEGDTLACVSFDCKPFATALCVPPFFFDIANRIFWHCEPINPFSVGNIGIGTGWFCWASIYKLRLVALSTKRARQD